MRLFLRRVVLRILRGLRARSLVVLCLVLGGFRVLVLGRLFVFRGLVLGGFFFFRFGLGRFCFLVLCSLFLLGGFVLGGLVVGRARALRFVAPSLRGVLHRIGLRSRGRRGCSRRFGCFDLRGSCGRRRCRHRCGWRRDRLRRCGSRRRC